MRSLFGLISYTSSSDEEILVPALINEDRYKVEDEYKITLQCIYEGFGSQDFYVSDLNSLFTRGHIQILNYIKSH